MKSWLKRRTSKAERAASLAALDVLDTVDLTDDALFAVNADPEQLAAVDAQAVPLPAAGRGAVDRRLALYELALDQSCRLLVQLAELLAHEPRTSMHAPLGQDHDVAFESTYLSLSADRQRNTTRARFPSFSP